MENGNYVLGVGGLVVLLGFIAWWIWQRVIARMDKTEENAEKAKDADLQAQLKELKESAKRSDDNYQELRIEIEKRVTNAALETIRADFKQDFKELTAKFDAVLAHTGGRRKA